jgi:hypothetical protein
MNKIIKNIASITEIVSAVLLHILIYYHCRWYAYDYKIDNGDKQIARYGLNHTPSVLGCYLDNSSTGQMIRSGLMIGSGLYLVSLVCRILPQMEDFSRYTQMTGLVLIVCSMIVLTIFIYKRDMFEDLGKQEIIISMGARKGFTFSLVAIILLIISNILL